MCVPDWPAIGNSGVKFRSKLYFRLRVLLHPPYWSCAGPRSYDLEFTAKEELRWRTPPSPETLEGVSYLALVSITGGFTKTAIKGPARCFMFDACSGKLLQVLNSHWKGF